MTVESGAPEISVVHLFRARGTRRFVALAALVAAGILDYTTRAELASILFYVPILLALALVDAWGICLVYALVAAVITLGVDLAQDPARAVFVRPYWAALNSWAVFALIAGAVSLLVQERRRSRESEHALQDKTLELQDRQRRLEEAHRDVARLRDDLTRRERQAEIGDAVFATAYDMERPLASASVYIEELTRLIGRAHVAKNPQLVLDEIQPLLEKLEERVQSVDRILMEIRDLHKPVPRA